MKKLKHCMLVCCAFLALMCGINLNTSAQCAAGEVEYVISFPVAGSFAGEISWELLDASGAVVASEACGAFAAAPVNVCLVAGATYTFNADDDYGDGWNGYTYDISPAAGGCSIASNAAATPNNGVAGDATGDCAASDLEVSQAMTEGVPETLLGCTDPAATNYNACATADDGSCVIPAGCPAGQSEYQIDLTTGGFDGEISWQIVDSGGTVVAEQICGAYDPSVPIFVCLTDGETYTFNASDDWGDGWNGGTYSVTAPDGCVVASAAPNNGVAGDSTGDCAASDLEDSQSWVAGPTSQCDLDVTLPFADLVNGVFATTATAYCGSDLGLADNLNTNGDAVVYVAIAPFGECFSDYTVTTTAGVLLEGDAVTVGAPLVLAAGVVGFVQLTTADLAGPVTITYTSNVDAACTGTAVIDPATLVDVAGNAFVSAEEACYCIAPAATFVDITCDPLDDTVYCFNIDITDLGSATFLEYGYDDGTGFVSLGQATATGPVSICGIPNTITVDVVLAFDGITVDDPATTLVEDQCTVAFFGVSDSSCAPPPANDLCADATPIACGDALAGTNVGATNSAEAEALGSCGTTPSAGGVWYSWTGDGSTVTLSTCDAATFDTKINVYEGDCAAPVCVGGNDDGAGCTGFTSSYEFDSVLGTNYFIFVSGFDADEIGDFTLSMSCVACTPPTIGDVFYNCQDGTFTYDVTVAFGDPAGAYTISTDYDATTYPALDGAAVTIGPFPNATALSITVTDDNDAACSAVAGPFDGPSCFVATAACGETITSPDDPTNPGFYPINTDATWEICDPSGAPVTLTFGAVATEATYDIVYVFEGVGITGTQIGAYDAATAPPATITSTDASGCLTVLFLSDFSVVQSGFTADVTLGVPGEMCDDLDANTIMDVWDATGCVCAGVPAVVGCMDATNCNYNPLANVDDPTMCLDLDCEDVCGGTAIVGSACTDLDGMAGTYDAACTCVATIVMGCIDPASCTYDPTANTDDGSCLYDDCVGVCGGTALPGTACDDGDPVTVGDTYDANCNCTGAAVPGCIDPASCTYDPTATTDDGSCLYDDCNGVCGGADVPGAPCDDGNPDTAGDAYNGACECTGAFTGDDCNDPNADNFSPLATGDSQCNYLGCTDPGAVNYNPDAAIDDGSCVFANCTLDGSISQLSNAQGSILPTYYDAYELVLTGFTSPLTYDWDRSGYVRVSSSQQEGTMSILASDDASFSVTVTDANGCVFIFDEDYNGATNNGGGDYNGGTIIPDADVVLNSITGETLSDENGAINISIAGGVGPFEYAWTGPGAYTSTAEDISGLESGHYYLTVTDLGTGQETTVSYWVPKDRESGRLKAGLAEVTIDVYPNPFATVANLQFASTIEGPVTVELVDLSGKVVAALFEGNVEASVLNTLSIDGTKLPTGVYMAQITTPDGAVETVKVVLAR